MKLSDGEKLIVLMLCDIQKAMNAKGIVNPDAAKAAILSGDTAELERQLNGAFGHGNKDRSPAYEVAEILGMWSTIERGYKRLSMDEKQEVEAGAGPLGRGVRFSGFDGETERQHREIAHFLIEKTDRFERFQGRNLDAHMPTLAGYRRMLDIFDRLCPAGSEARIGARQIIELANAEKYAS